MRRSRRRIVGRRFMDAELRALAERKGYKVERAITPDSWRLIGLDGKVVIKPDRTVAFATEEARAFLQGLPDAPDDPSVD
jgi:hypothetical protein